jgi:hypothetical protein
MLSSPERYADGSWFSAPEALGRPCWEGDPAFGGARMRAVDGLRRLFFLYSSI